MHTLTAIILAAGKGTRMNSDLPKVAHEVGGRAMVRWVAEACAEAGCSRVIVVVGYKQEVVRAIFDDWADEECSIEFAVQEEQLGTGHAVMCAEPLLHAEAATAGHATFVLAGDGPLIRSETLATILHRHEESSASATIATAVLDNPDGYGRIVRDPRGGFARIVEQKNASREELAIREVNPSYYCFDVQTLFSLLKRVERNELSGEYYITDVPALALAGGLSVEVIDAVPAEDVLSINTPEQLGEVDAVLRKRLGMPVAAEGGSA